MQPDWLLQTIYLVPIYPLVAFALVVLGRAFKTRQADGTERPLMPREGASALTIGATGLGLVHAVSAASWLLKQPHPMMAHLEQNWNWLQIQNLTFSLGTLIDPASVMMLFVVTFISLFIQIYTHGYMDHDKGYAKFFGYLALFNFSMLGLVLSSNLFQTYIFWELVGLCSFLLIGFWFTKNDSGPASLKAFMTNRVGDFGFLIGILLLFAATLPFWLSPAAAKAGFVVLSFRGISEIAPSLAQQIGPAVAIIFGLLFMGPMAKSAQVPFHIWLPDAMAGPTPISALIHAATMVAAGVFLTGRLFPLLHQSPEAQLFVTIIGVATAFIGATIALTQNDIKKALAYSTMSQLGFMITAMGVGAYSAALFHLFTHAFFKAMLFLGSGSVIHACEDEQDMRKMGGLFKKLPVTAWTYLIGTVAISGLAWTSGFWSKDEILLAAKGHAPWVFTLLAITAGMTSFYMFRTFILTFLGAYRGEAHVHPENPVMTMPLVVLAVPSLFIGMALGGVFPNLPSFAGVINLPMLLGHGDPAHAPAFFSEVGNLSQMIGLSGAVLSFLCFLGMPQLLNNPFSKAILAPFKGLFANKWFFDDLVVALSDFGFTKGLAPFLSWFDSFIVDGLVRGSAVCVRSSGELVRKVQMNGAIQTYVLSLLAGLLFLLVWVAK
jgi:proton-translocating NADH-quinone oxidoreductase chain L